MPHRSLKWTAFVVALVLALPSASAQQLGGTTTGDTGGTTGTGQLDADEAFSEVERSETIGRTGATGQGFSEASTATGTTGGGGLGGLGGFGGLGGGFSALGNLFGGLNSGASQSNQPVIRTRLRSAIAVSPTPPAMVQQSAVTRFRTLASRPQLRGINVRMDGRTAILSGVVPTASDRRMSEMLIRLEPGVSRIDNQISVAQ